MTRHDRGPRRSVHRRLNRGRNNKGERGQSIVLLAVTSLILAATLLTTFSVGKAIHERVAVQQAADAAAYSLAVEEARAFNYYAYTNRASVSHYLATMALYGHMSYALAWESYLSVAQSVWCQGGESISTQLEAAYGACEAENAECPGCCGCLTSVCNCIDQEYNDLQNNPCQTVSQDLQNIQNQMQSFISGLHSQAQDELKVVTGSITKGQKGVDKAVYDALNTPSKFTDPIARSFNSKFTSKAVAANKSGVSSSGGKTAAGYCDATAGFSCGGDGVIHTQWSAANADRYQPMEPSGDWTRNREVNMTGSLIGLQLEQIFDSSNRFFTSISGTGMSRLVVAGGSGTQDPKPDLHVTDETDESGYRTAAHDHGSMAGMDIGPLECGWTEPPTASDSSDDVKAYAYSTPTGNSDGTQSAYASGSDETTGTIDLGGCVSSGGTQTCGILEPQMNFIIAVKDQKQVLFNQPRTFAVIEESFDKSRWGPFGIKLDDAIKMFDGSTKASYDNIVNDTTIKGRESILAVSSGLAYYHHPGVWREPPNFYNPYWRAKLHPFNTKTDELSQVVKSAGYTGNSGTDFLGPSGLPATQ